MGLYLDTLGGGRRARGMPARRTWKDTNHLMAPHPPASLPACRKQWLAQKDPLSQALDVLPSHSPGVGSLMLTVFPEMMGWHVTMAFLISSVSQQRAALAMPATHAPFGEAWT